MIMCRVSIVKLVFIWYNWSWNSLLILEVVVIVSAWKDC